MLKMFKEIAEQAQTNYKNMVETAIRGTIKESLPYEVDEGASSYYAVVYSTERCEATEEDVWNFIKSCQLKEEKLLRAEIHKCSDIIYNILLELDKWCEVLGILYSNGTICYNIKVDGMEFEIELVNRFDNN